VITINVNGGTAEINVYGDLGAEMPDVATGAERKVNALSEATVDLDAWEPESTDDEALDDFPDDGDGGEPSD
jgi:hypothetical protein